MAAKIIAYGKDYGSGFCRWQCLEVWQGKPRLAVVSDQTKLRLLAILNAFDEKVPKSDIWGEGCSQKSGATPQNISVSTFL